MTIKYEALANDIEALIASGTLAIGDRLPSVRDTVASRGLSPATVFEAYYRLEARGLVEARPRAGYFVKAVPAPREEPRGADPVPGSQDVAVNDVVQAVLGSVRDRQVAPLGSAFPSPELFPLERLARGMGAAMRRLDPRQLLEDLTPGNAELRRQIALRGVAQGLSIGVDEVVITSGAMEALTLGLQAVTQPGDVVAIESPAFYGCLQTLERLRLKAVEVATHPRTGVQVDSLAEVLRRHPVKACWFMPSFQNPLGALMPENAKRAMVELLARHEVPLIEDDVYAELYFGAQRPLPAKAWDRHGGVMHCSSFSKSLAPGYRVGWVSAGRFAPQVNRLKFMSTLGVSVPAQLAVLHFLQHGAFDKHLRQLRTALAARQQRALLGIEKYFPEGTRVTRPEGGYFLWVELPEAVDAMALQQAALARHISLAPGPLFSADRRFRHHVRLNVGHPRVEQLDAALKTLGRLVG
ncbi:MAG: aminotransferase class I/II-fold pyridoxal phosphate-dependent enzyme [Hydrogenophaga sp.]|uniref:aminotransferase-like domain-containing protein n=1 Tax=Hydrogenophaga sp. TaxID=1904254 RepID=UPI00169E1F55|nr:PLP-dependent aminotransferase family protein [Hydrogenophaga sp.]NIM43307.1 aminotransferase class I/II-fold pyridoxal phosphate-dependent enzyme [Hydrogenophaga sp.]NIN28376.1 aminotransferase class I/II-fold pyridoxal phosphate-dependent enzyme [Hydrogenophaga sp.]NIN29195.1 aminotransferase class I/II-fold pyridoxal phosphate-dependent enzyme [Hydrogenophaga sp.]NIN57510.1 aminotransferase class I/II-fold pyridoxal phosphate-dependent enzyme [Hydrogenophaga sp.]NIO53805.1 aminotransfera